MSLYDCALRSALHSAKPDTNLLNRQMENDLPPEALVFLTKMNIFFILLLIFLVIIAIFWLIELMLVLMLQ